MTRDTTLHALLGKLFSPEELRIYLALVSERSDLVSALPEVGVSKSSLIAAAVDAMQRYSFIDREFFDRLEDARPKRVSEIRRVRALWLRGARLDRGELWAEGRYELLARRGGGGFSLVWKAIDTQTGAFVALKILSEMHADDRRVRQRFFRGAAILSELSHPAIIRVRSSVEQEGLYYYYVMDYIDGESLDMLIDRRPRTELLDIVFQAAEALGHVHARGLLHRDIKPSNILVTSKGQAKLIDFDLVTGGSFVSMTTRALGTASYSPPEAHASDKKTTAYDVFSLARTFEYVLRGREPNVLELTAPEFMAGVDTSEAVKQVLQAALCPDPATRLSSVVQFCVHLRSALGALVSASPNIPPALESAIATPEEIPIDTVPDPVQLRIDGPPPGATESLSALLLVPYEFSPFALDPALPVSSLPPSKEPSLGAPDPSRRAAAPPPIALSAPASDPSPVPLSPPESEEPPSTAPSPVALSSILATPESVAPPSAALHATEHAPSVDRSTSSAPPTTARASTSDPAAFVTIGSRKRIILRLLGGITVIGFVAWTLNSLRVENSPEVQVSERSQMNSETVPRPTSEASNSSNDRITPTVSPPTTKDLSKEEVEAMLTSPREQIREGNQMNSEIAPRPIPDASNPPTASITEAVSPPATKMSKKAAEPVLTPKTSSNLSADGKTPPPGDTTDGSGGSDTRFLGPEISHSKGQPGGVVVLYPRIIPGTIAEENAALAAEIQQKVKAVVEQALPGRPINVRPKPERVCPKAGCDAVSINVLFTRDGKSCIAVALINAPGTSPIKLIPWGGLVKLKRDTIQFRDMPENYVHLEALVPCDQLVTSMAAQDRFIEAAIRAAASSPP